ncbi:cytochrome P450 [Nocardia sp. NPDC049149]|uniref:cytochrome P450 n=1 Tax=Nocardia sp. NPDC049149 TaxID=3364315 RepID=UPI003715FED8
MNHPDPTDSAGCPTDVAAAARAAGCPAHQAAPAQTVIPSSAVLGPPDSHRKQLWRFMTRRTEFLNECRERYGTRFLLHIKPGLQFFVLSDPDDVRAVYQAPRTSLHCGNSNGALEKYFGNTGIAYLDEGEHLARRRALTRSFKGAAFKRIQDAVEEITIQAVAEWPRDEAIEMHDLVHRWAMNVIREVVFGKVVPSNWDRLLDALMALVEFNTYKTAMLQIDNWSPTTKFFMKLLPGTGVRNFWKRRPVVDALLAEAVAERLRIGELGDDMLSVMLAITREDGTQLSGVELRDEMMTMFIAGTVTTVSAVCWSLEYLTRDPEVLGKLRAELDAGESEEYLTAVVHEVLRINPPLPMNLARQVVEPIEIGGVRYERGQLLVPSAELLNNDPVRYPSPEQFRPERFLGSAPGTFSWIPFGGGHTRCMGDRIAVHEIKVMLREVLTHCELSRADREPSKAKPRGPVIVPSNGPHLTLRRRAAVPVHS